MIQNLTTQDKSSDSHIDSKQAEYRVEYLKRGFRTVSVIETVIYIFAVYLAGLVISPEDPLFSRFTLHPFFAVCFLIPMRYGLGESATASLICSLLLGFIIYNNADKEFFSWINCYKTFKVPLLMTCFSIFGGYIREEALEREKSVEDTLKALLLKKEKMDKRIHSTEQALVELETRILSTESDVLDHVRDFTYYYFEDLDELVNKMTESLISFTDAGEVVYAYIEKGSITKVVKRIKNTKKTVVADLESLLRDPIVQEAIRTRQLSKIGDCLTKGVYDNFQEYCIIAVPIMDKSENLLGIAGIRRLPFINYIPYTIKITSTMSRLWQTAFAQYYLRKKLELDVLFDKRLRIGTHKHLIDHMQSEFMRHEKLKYDLVMGIIEIPERHELSDKKIMFLEKIIIELLEGSGIKRDTVYRFCTRACFALFSDDGSKDLIEQAMEYTASEFVKLRFETGENKRLTCSYYIYKRDLETRDFQDYLKKAYNGLKTPSKLDLNKFRARDNRKGH